MNERSRLLPHQRQTESTESSNINRPLLQVATGGWRSWRNLVCLSTAAIVTGLHVGRQSAFRYRASSFVSAATTSSFTTASFVTSFHSQQSRSHWCKTRGSRRFGSMDETCRDVSLSDFVQSSRTRLEEGRKSSTHGRWHFVVGNQAGDADSIVSALTWAYVQQRSHHDIIPVVSIARRDLETQRPETLLLLQLAGVTTDSLVYINDDILMQAIHNEPTVYWTLMDHNRLASADVCDPNRTVVLEIVDHHFDEGLYVDTTASGTRIIAFADGHALVASTCTLVVERWREKYTIPMPASVGLVLLGAILLDTIHMNPEAGKATERDGAAIRFLLDHVDWIEWYKDMSTSLVRDAPAYDMSAIVLNQLNQPDTTVLFHALQNAKFAPTFWQGLSVRDALRLDYKRFTPGPDSTYADTAFGISTVLVPWTTFRDKDTVASSVRDFMHEMNVPLFGIMLAYAKEGGGLHRELVLVTLDDSILLDAMVDFLLVHEQNLLGLSELLSRETSSDAVHWRCFVQHNAKASRKQVAPAMLQFFEPT